MSGSYLRVADLPGTWQFWCEGENGTCWLAPVDEAARAAADKSSSGFALVKRSRVTEIETTAEASLF